MNRSNAYIACNLTGSRGTSGLYVVTPSGHVDWPVRWPDGRIAYDWPELVPQWLKREVARAIELMA